MVMGLDVGLHGIDAELLHTRGGGGEERGDGLAGGDIDDIAGAIADEQSLGECLVSIQSPGVVFAGNPGTSNGYGGTLTPALSRSTGRGSRRSSAVEYGQSA